MVVDVTAQGCAVASSTREIMGKIFLEWWLFPVSPSQKMLLFSPEMPQPETWKIRAERQDSLGLKGQFWTQIGCVLDT